MGLNLDRRVIYQGVRLYSGTWTLCWLVIAKEGKHGLFAVSKVGPINNIMI